MWYKGGLLCSKNSKPMFLNTSSVIGCESENLIYIRYCGDIAKSPNTLSIIDPQSRQMKNLQPKWLSYLWIPMVAPS
jgi:hypothetical protein